jgi:hypothetical protein
MKRTAVVDPLLKIAETIGKGLPEAGQEPVEHPAPSHISAGCKTAQSLGRRLELEQ